MGNDTKAFYASYHDEIFAKRYQSPYPIRRLTHQDIYESVLRHVPPGARVLDAGCGEGVLSILMRQRGALVTGVDYSAPNIEAARRYAEKAGLEGDGLTFLQGDAEHLPFEDDAFDLVVSNHVLEHLPDFRQGAREIRRVTKGPALIGVPTCLNPSAWALLGGDTYWRLSKRSIYAVPFGLLRVAGALLTRQEGVNEGYGGSKDNIHIFRFPWVVEAILKEAGFRELRQEAQSIRLPYLPASCTHLSDRSPFKHFGIGTLYAAHK
jgi:ubiquinone/menaquinone biosynthesis C-methylase UbiE